jgi:hypothetical protein
MGIEIFDMELEDLDNILNEISKGNTRDMSTFRDVILEMYGGMNIRQYQKLEGFIRSELGLNSDSELSKMNEQDKNKIIEYLH